MATVTAGNSATVTLSAGQVLIVSTAGEAAVDIRSGITGAGFSSQRVVASAIQFGPYPTEGTLRVRAVSGDATYDAQTVGALSGLVVVSEVDPVDNDGRPDGTVWLFGGQYRIKRGGKYQAPTQSQAAEFRQAFGLAPIPPAPPARWRLPVTAAVDSGADAALVSALVGSEMSLARPFYSVAAGATRTIAVKIGEIAALGGLLSFAVGASSASNTFSATVEQSFDSTDGSNGTWSAVPFSQVFPSGGDSSAGAINKRQPCRIAAGPARWLRLAVTAGASAVTVQPLIHQLQSGGQDCWVVIGASLEGFGMRSVDAEDAVIAQFPDRDPVVFLHAVGGVAGAQVAAHAADAMARLGDLFRYVIVGNALGNDISAAQPIADDSEASLDALRATYASILGAFPGKTVFPCLHTYRAYSGVTPTTPANGSLPYNQRVIEPVIRELLPKSVPVADMYAAAQFNRAILSDNVHFTFQSGGYGWERAEWAATAFAAAYGAPVTTFVERLVAAAERGQASATEAQYAVSSLSPSDLKNSLAARVTALAAASTVRIGFGSSAATAGWNKTASFSAGTPIANLVNAAGTATGWSLVIVDAGTINSVGLGARGVPLGFPFPPEITLNSMADTSASIAIRIAGVPGGAYRVRLFASRVEVDRRVVDYTIGSEVRSLNVANNANQIAEFEYLAVTGGQIDITASRGAGNASAVYFGGIIIDRLA